MGKVLALILAGGRGKRMDILCCERPKPVLPFAGRFRVIDFSLSNCLHSGIENISILTDYQRSSMSDYLAQWGFINARPGNFHILEPGNGSYRGTADAVYQTLDYLQKRNADTALILSGDHIYKMDYRRMLAFHNQVGADVTVGVVSVPAEEAHRFGIVTTEANGRVVNFVEKPKIPQSNLVSMGIYVFNVPVLSDRLIENAAMPDSPRDFGHDIIPQMVTRDKVFAYKFEDYWQDIGTTEAYYNANMEFSGKPSSFSMNGKWTVLTVEKDLPPAVITAQGAIRNSLISPGCMIKGRVENSVLSPGVRIEARATVKNSVLMDNVIVGYHGVVDRCILDEDVKIGEFSYIGFGGTLFYGHRCDVTVLGKNVTVPSRTAIGRSCKIFPGAGPANFNAGVVPSEAIISGGL